MKLEVGMYVRTKKGTITKIKSITRSTNYGEETVQARFICEDNNIYDYDKYDTSNDIKWKPSHNIIDLIQVGDYVNGYKVIDFIYCGGGFTDIRKQGVRVDGEIWAFDYDEIKSIITKEQFESMSYKVEE